MREGCYGGVGGMVCGVGGSRLATGPLYNVDAAAAYKPHCLQLAGSLITDLNKILFF